MMGFSPNQMLFLLLGAGWTILLSACGFVGGSVLGIGIALARISANLPLRALSAGYIQIVQSLPVPVLMFVSYFGLALTGYDIPGLLAAGL